MVRSEEDLDLFFVVTGENFTDFVQSFSRNDDFCAFIFIF